MWLSEVWQNLSSPFSTLHRFFWWKRFHWSSWCHRQDWRIRSDWFYRSDRTSGYVTVSFCTRLQEVTFCPANLWLWSIISVWKFDRSQQITILHLWSDFEARGSTQTHPEDQSVDGHAYTSCTGALLSVAQSAGVAQHNTCSPLGNTSDWYMIQCSTLGRVGKYVSLHMVKKTIVCRSVIVHWWMCCYVTYVTLAGNDSNK